jgi:GNAT superfamily N-acetyltransferase
MRAPGVPSPNFNVVSGLSDEQADDVDALTAWFNEAGMPGRFVLAPGRPVARIGRALAARGFAHTEFHAAFAGFPEPAEDPSPRVTVRRITADEIEMFEDAYHAAWEVTAYRVPMSPWLSLPGWSLYVGFVDGAPAGTAMLSVHEGVGYLADAAVAPGFRGHGLHQALLHRRIADARDVGADLICSQAAFLSTSARNMQRVGLSLLYTQAIWTPAQPEKASG